MRTQITRLAILGMLCLGGCGYTEFSETESTDMHADAHRLRLMAESRLDSQLREIQRLVETADTSSTDRERLRRILSGCTDNDGRLVVVIELWGMSALNRFMPLIDSLGAIVETEAYYYPVMTCRILPLDISPLMNSDAVMSIRMPVGGQVQYRLN